MIYDIVSLLYSLYPSEAALDVWLITSLSYSLLWLSKEAAADMISKMNSLILEHGFKERPSKDSEDDWDIIQQEEIPPEDFEDCEFCEGIENGLILKLNHLNGPVCFCLWLIFFKNYRAWPQSLFKRQGSLSVYKNRTRALRTTGTPKPHPKRNLLPLLTGQTRSYILLDMSHRKQSNYRWVTKGSNRSIEA
jgi:hypothetical protein